MKSNEVVEQTQETIDTLITDNDHLMAEVDVLTYKLAMAIDQISRMKQDQECVDYCL